MIPVLFAYLPLLAMTLAIELAVVAAAAPRDCRRLVLTVCLALNLLTHPMATLLSWRWQVDPFTLEGLVFFFEWLGYAQLLGLRPVGALRYALLPNVLSAAAGVALWFARMR